MIGEKIPVVIVLYNKIQRWSNSEIIWNIIEIPLQEERYVAWTHAHIDKRKHEYMMLSQNVEPEDMSLGEEQSPALIQVQF